MEGLLEALPRLARDTGVGVVVLTGAGRAFCAGGDVKSMAERSAERSMEEAVIHLRGRMEVSRLLHEMPKPTIAMVNGPAAGAGMSLALACDLRIAANRHALSPLSRTSGFPATLAAVIFSPNLSVPARRVSSTTQPTRWMPRRPLPLE